LIWQNFEKIAKNSGTSAMIISLYDDQMELFDKILAAMRQGFKRILVRAETGSGKTVVGSYMMQRANAKGFRCAFDVPRKELLHQTAKTFRSFNIDYSYVAAGQFFDENSTNWICSTGTWHNRLDKFQADVVIIDETHYGATQRDKIIKYYTDLGKYVIGLSATPEKQNGQSMSKWYDVMVEGEDLQWLIDHGRLSDYKVFVPHTISVDKLKVVNGEYSKTQADALIEADRVLVGNVIDYYAKHAMGRRHLTFAQNVRKSKDLASKFCDAGIPTAHMDGDTPDGERKRIINEFADGRIYNICSVDLLLFGFDLSAQVGRDVPVESMSDVRLSRSRNTQRQKWGRVLRYKDYPALIFDHVGNALPERHGQPSDPQEWRLEGRVGGRKKTRQQIEANRQCTECFHMHATAPVCPNCGHIYPKKKPSELEEVDGELVELERKRVIKEKKREEGMCNSLEDWKKIEKERGYKSGWARRRWELRNKKNKR
jgi:DNA repair protein RadD